MAVQIFEGVDGLYKGEPIVCCRMIPEPGQHSQSGDVKWLDWLLVDRRESNVEGQGVRSEDHNRARVLLRDGTMYTGLQVSRG